MIKQHRQRPPELDIAARIRFAVDPEGTISSYRTTICTLTDHGAMILVDLPCGVRAALYEKIRHCVLEFTDQSNHPFQILARAVWFQPQTATDELMTVKIGVSFEQVTNDMAVQLNECARKATLR